MSAASDPPIQAPSPPPHLLRKQRACRPRLRAGVFALGFAIALSFLVAPGAGAQETHPASPHAGPAPGVAPDAAAKDAGLPQAAPDAPHRKLPKDKRTQLEGLFAALQAAPDPDSATRITGRLDRIFEDSGSSAADLLMARATAAMATKNYDLAIELLSQVLRFEPDYLGALSRRATLYYMKDQYAEALADVREVLAREPRHYAMLYELALILRDIDQEGLALQAVRKALAVNPQLEGAQEMEKQLTVKVEGRQI